VLAFFSLEDEAGRTACLSGGMEVQPGRSVRFRGAEFDDSARERAVLPFDFPLESGRCWLRADLRESRMASIPPVPSGGPPDSAAELYLNAA
jgi:hypothetical protein